MTAQAPVLRVHGNAYNIFILVLTIFSLALMALLVIPWVDPETRQLLNVYDNAVCVIFLIDFTYNITGAKPRSAYFIRQRGWLDLLGSIPSFGFFQLTALLRLARLSRLARIRKLHGRPEAQSSSSRTCSTTAASTRRSSRSSPRAWSCAWRASWCCSSRAGRPTPTSRPAATPSGGRVVTITTVGYGDFYPVTTLGRLTGVSVMFAGVGIIGALASILASILVPPPKPASDEPEPEVPGGVDRLRCAVAGPALVGRGRRRSSPSSRQLRAEVRALRDVRPREPG